MTDRMVRWGGVAAIVFVVIILITVFSAGQPPAADDAVEKIRTYFVDHRSAILFSNFLGLLATPFVVWFFVVLREVFRGDRMSNALGTAALAGAVVTAPLAMVGGALTSAPGYVDGAADKLNNDTLRFAFEAQSLVFAATSGGIVLLAVVTALAIRRTRALPAYTMWLALLAVVGNLATMVSVLGAGAAGVGFLGILTFALFLLVTGITMAAGKVRPAAIAATAV
jgi:hypothetical protein